MLDFLKNECHLQRGEVNVLEMELVTLLTTARGLQV